MVICNGANESEIININNGNINNENSNVNNGMW